MSRAESLIFLVRFEDIFESKDIIQREQLSTSQYNEG